MEQGNMPLGLSFALAQNPKAMQAFIHLSETKQHEILRKSHVASSKNEMQALVDGLSAQVSEEC